MSIWFARPNAAFRAYERSLLRPIARPAPRDTPSLWSRAKEMFGVMLEKARTIADLALRHRLSREERREILIRLQPVEKLTRDLLVTEAATFLLMTPEGMKLRREARIIALPVRTPPPPPRKTSALVTGIRTLAVFDPVTLAVLRPTAPIPTAKPAAHDATEPARSRCSFKVMHWVHPESDARTPSGKPAPRPRLFTYDDIVAFTPTPRREPLARDTNAGAAIARRIEALSRVIEKPERTIRRIARFLASLPREALEPLDPIWAATLHWYHGRLEVLAAHDLAERAFMAFARARLQDFDGPQPEPG